MKRKEGKRMGGEAKGRECLTSQTRGGWRMERKAGLVR